MYVMSFGELLVIGRKTRIDFDITCSENFTDEGACESWAYSKLESELYAESSEFDFSDFTPSIWCESGSQFSKKSINDESRPTFQLSPQFAQEFCKSTFALATDREDSSHLIDNHHLRISPN